MKKLLVVALISLLLCSLSTFAGAYVFSASATGASSNIQFGTGSSSTISLGYPPANSVIFGVVNDTGGLCSKLILPTDPGKWDLAIWGNSYTNNTTMLSIWVTSSGTESTPGGNIAGQIWQFKSIAGGNVLWTGAIPASGTLFQLSIPIVNSAFPMVDANYTFQRTVPEPASIAALLSGIVGFAGLALRRRK